MGERFWERQEWHGNLAGDQLLRVWHATEHQPGTGGILTGYLTDAPAVRVQHLCAEAMRKMLLRELDAVIGPWQETLERVMTTDRL